LGLTKLPDGRVSSSPPQTKKKWGLDVGIGLNKPSQHLGPNFRLLFTGEKTDVCLKYFEEKIQNV
jgi:hypothetical protein